MSRKGSISRYTGYEEPIYGDYALGKLINHIMRDGKKGLSEKIVYGALEIIGEKSGEDPMEVFKQAMENVKPILEVRARRVGGATYQVPVEVRQDRRQALAIRWIVSYARGRKGRGMQEKLAAELLEAAEGAGGAVRKREDTHKMAEANKAFAHYRW
ncbi:MAG: 30S ribosomal protein S7 [Clostridia bacterium]|nr:30S ribosomal protein S7 [Clostridia bacterium]